MDAKYNKYIDSFAVRVTMIALGFTVWLAAAVALLSV